MWDSTRQATQARDAVSVAAAPTGRSRAARCPFDEAECAEQAARQLDVIAHTPVAALGICLGRHRVVWSSGHLAGPVGAWVASTARARALHDELFPRFRPALAMAIKTPEQPLSVLTILPSAHAPLPAEASISIVNRSQRDQPHLALVVLSPYVDPTLALPPFEVAIHRALVAGTGIEAAVTSADLRITWASPALEERAGSGSLVGRRLLEVTSAQERDMLIDLGRQASHRREGKPALSRMLPTGRRASVLDRTHDPVLAGLVWWWEAGTRAGADVDRLSQVERLVMRFVDELAFAGVDTARDATSALGRLVPAVDLTDREREILELLVTGLRVPSIATRLFISPSTVRNHLSTGFKKLGVASQAEFLALVVSPEASTNVDPSANLDSTNLDPSANLDSANQHPEAP